MVSHSSYSPFLSRCSHPQRNQNVYEDAHPELTADIREVFLRCDREGKGYLIRPDFKVAIVGLLGYKPSKFEVEYMSRGVDFDKHGRI